MTNFWFSFVFIIRCYLGKLLQKSNFLCCWEYAGTLYTSGPHLHCGRNCFIVIYNFLLRWRTQA